MSGTTTLKHPGCYVCAALAPTAYNTARVLGSSTGTYRHNSHEATWHREPQQRGETPQQREIREPEPREETPQQRQIRETAVDTLHMLDDTVPDSTIHFAVEQARRALRDLIRHSDRIHTHDAK